MLTYDTTFELSRQRIAAAEARATFLARLGELPRPRARRPFRRTVRPLLDTIEIQHRPSDSERMKRRLMELAADCQKAS